MKTAILFAFLLLCVNTLSAQTYAYQPMIDTSIEWHMHYRIYPQGNLVEWDRFYSFSGKDTVIGEIPTANSR